MLLLSMQVHDRIHRIVLRRYCYDFLLMLHFFYFSSVDSIGWVRDDSIVVGCVQLNEEDNEEGYLVQVIRSGGNSFFQVSCSSNWLPLLFKFILHDVSSAKIVIRKCYFWEHACIKLPQTVKDLFLIIFMYKTKSEQ